MIVKTDNNKQDNLKIFIAMNDNSDDALNTLEYWSNYVTIIFSDATGGKPADTTVSKDIVTINATRINNLAEKNEQTEKIFFKVEKQKDLFGYKIRLPIAVLGDLAQWKVVHLKIGIGKNSKDQCASEKVLGQFKIGGTETYVIVLAVLGSIAAVTLAVVIYCKCTEKLCFNSQESKQYDGEELSQLVRNSTYRSTKQQNEAQLAEILRNSSTKTKTDIRNCFIEPGLIKRSGTVLGKGQYGVVSVGEYDGKKVCIKTCKNPGDIGELFEEAVPMKHFEHENVMKLIGVSLSGEKGEIVLPFMDKGDLHSYLRKEENEIQYPTAVKFSLMAAQGMQYLAQKNIIHRDLAARNCLLETSEDMKGKQFINLKIGDFGLSRHGENNYDNSIYQ